MTSLPCGASPTDLQEPPPYRFSDRYLIQRELGHGGTAVVYLATDSETGRAVAIKILKQELAESVGSDRFLREIKLTGQLDHLRIMPVLDSGTQDGQLFFVLPFMDGGTLRDRMKRDGQLPVDEAVAIARAIADALEYAHARGVIHRDVKPENILFSEGEPYLADFGIARDLERLLGETTTSTGMVRGTPLYMSPEQAAGEAKYDGRSDQYSLGTVLYEMLAGVPPYVGPTAQSVIAQRLTHAPHPVHFYRPTVHARLEDIVTRAMAIAPVERFASMRAFRDALDALGRGSGTLAVEKHRRTRERRWTPGRVGAVALVLAAIVLAARVVVPRFPARVVLDANRVAVAPFDVKDLRDTIWRVGLVDVLSRNFDGAGPLRAVSPSVVLASWRGRADVTSASALGKQTGAQLVVYGQLLRTGANSDSLRLTVSLLDGSGTKPRDVEISEAASRMDRLADTVTVLLLQRIRQTRSLGSTPVSLGAHSLSALKAFLQGEQAYRANRYEEARGAYQEALAADTGFALAYRRLRNVNRATSGIESDSLSLWYASQAGARNHKLGRRDSLLIVADSLLAASPGATFYSYAAQNRLRRRFAALNGAAKDYPNDAEIQYELGEVRYHLGDHVGVTQSEALEAFEASIRLDSMFGPAYYHAAELALPLTGPNGAALIADKYDRLNPAAPRYDALARLLRDPSEKALARWDSASADVLQDAIQMTRRWPQNDAAAIKLSQQGYKLGTAIDSSHTEGWVFRILQYRGRLKEAQALHGRATAAAFPPYLLEMALHGVITSDSARRVITGWVDGKALDNAYLSISYWAARRDVAMLERVAALFDSAEKAAPAADEVPYALAGARSARAHLTLLRGDSATSLLQLTAIQDSLCTWFCSHDRLLAARLLIAAGRARDAAAYLDRHPPPPGPTTITEAYWMFERARAAQALGDRRVAQRDYQFVSDVLGGADTDFQAMVQHARAFPGVTGPQMAESRSKSELLLASSDRLMHDRLPASSTLALSEASHLRRRVGK
ncbi:MAG: serine/threonine-protein kinase [bacterium]